MKLREFHGTIYTYIYIYICWIFQQTMFDCGRVTNLQTNLLFSDRVAQRLEVHLCGGCLNYLGVWKKHRGCELMVPVVAIQIYPQTTHCHVILPRQPSWMHRLQCSCCCYHVGSSRILRVNTVLSGSHLTIQDLWLPSFSAGACLGAGRKSDLTAKSAANKRMHI